MNPRAAKTIRKWAEGRVPLNVKNREKVVKAWVRRLRKHWDGSPQKERRRILAGMQREIGARPANHRPGVDPTAVLQFFKIVGTWWVCLGMKKTK